MEIDNICHGQETAIAAIQWQFPNKKKPNIWLEWIFVGALKVTTEQNQTTFATFGNFVQTIDGDVQKLTTANDE